MVDPCPYCKTPPAVIEDLAENLFSIGCRQAFIRPLPNEAICEKHPALMGMPTRIDAVSSWNQWCRKQGPRRKEGVA